MSSEDNFSDSHLENLDLNLLRVFLVLMQQRSVTKASEQLGRTQSAVSHSLAKLREFFHDDLFNRDSGAMEPTARAKELAQVVGSSLLNINNAVGRHLNFNPATTTRHFRIGVNDYVAPSYLPSLTSELIRQAPNAVLNVAHIHEAAVSGLLRSREIDYAIVAATAISDPRLEFVPLSQDRLLCVGWKGNPVFSSSMTLEDYLQSAHLQVSSDGVSPGAADRVLQARGIRRRVAATIPHYSVAPAILRNTELLTILGDSFLFSLGADSEMMAVIPPLDLPHLNICLVFDPVHHNDIGHTWLRDIIMQIRDSQLAQKRELLSRYGIDPLPII